MSSHPIAAETDAHRDFYQITWQIGQKASPSGFNTPKVPMFVDAPTFTDPRVAWSVGLSVTVVSHAKTAEPIDMPFGLWARVSSRNHVLDGGPDRPMRRAIFRGKDMPDDTAVSCAKMAEPIEMLFGLWSGLGWPKEACVTFDYGCTLLTSLITANSNSNKLG